MENYKIIEEKENALFNRKEIKASVDAKVTPSTKEVIALIAEKFSITEDAIKIQTILNKFGTQIPSCQSFSFSFS